MGRGFAWLDTGTPDSLIDAASFVRTLEQRQGTKISCPEEIAFDLGLIDVAQFKRLIARFGKSSYGQYLQSVLVERSQVHGAALILGRLAPHEGEDGAIVNVRFLDHCEPARGTERRHKSLMPVGALKSRRSSATL